MECSNLTSAHTINMRDIFNAPASTCMQSIMAAHIDELAMGMPEPALSPQPKTGKYWMWRERKREEGRGKRLRGRVDDQMLKGGNKINMILHVINCYVICWPASVKRITVH